jgi:hypothetical protein
MKKPKRKLTPAGKAAKKKRQQEFMTIFVHGKMNQVRRPPTIEGMSVEEFIRSNADPIWLHQEERWEDIEIEDSTDVERPFLDLAERFRAANEPEQVRELGDALGRLVFGE